MQLAPSLLLFSHGHFFCEIFYSKHLVPHFLSDRIIFLQNCDSKCAFHQCRTSY
jgi:hypothetical protein